MHKFCYYCGAPAVSNDHLPPSCIFDKPMPGNRIKVPSCHKHNVDQSKDDEYFRWFVATASADSPTAESLIRKKVASGFQHRPKLLRTILQDSGYVDLVSPAGIQIGKAPAFRFDRKRVQSVITRMTRGFFLHFFGERLPATHVVQGFLLNPELNGIVKKSLTQLPLHEIGGHVFSFRFQQDVDDPYFSVWFFMFFDKTLLVSMTDKQSVGNGS
jgi:hypothetical protein